MVEKLCTGCRAIKPPTDFHRCSSNKDGLQYRCIACHKERNKGRYRTDVEYLRGWRGFNPDYDKQRDRGTYHRDYGRANKEKKRLAQQQWCRENASLCAARAAKRRADTLKATPPWLSAENRECIRCLYDEAAALSTSTGVKHHVDHIVPLRGKTVCGLHVPWNLRVIPASENLSKRNKLIQ